MTTKKTQSKEGGASGRLKGGRGNLSKQASKRRQERQHTPSNQEQESL
jgi:hypothetical protein